MHEFQDWDLRPLRRGRDLDSPKQVLRRLSVCQGFITGIVCRATIAKFQQNILWLFVQSKQANVGQRLLKHEFPEKAVYLVKTSKQQQTVFERS